ncbi:MAG: hypothetical protein ABSC32_20805 [Steroidobacteraceae bacterium]|jgi:hypothetical protein
MLQSSAETADLIRRFQALRRSVLFALGVPGLVCGLLFILSVLLHWPRWTAYACFAAFFAVAVLVPIVMRCPACGRGNLAGGGNGFTLNPRVCPHCARPLRQPK